jgi:transposase
MGTAIGLRKDFSAEALRAMARRTKNGPQARRLLALAAIYDGATRSEAAKIGGVTLQIVLDWVLRFNADGPDGLVDRKAPGQPSLLKDEHRAALARIVEDGPTPAIHGVVRWRIVDLCQWLFEEFRISVSETTMSRELLRLILRGIDPAALETAFRRHASTIAKPHATDGLTAIAVDGKTLRGSFDTFRDRKAGQGSNQSNTFME